LPELTYVPVHFDPCDETEWASGWGQALQLLQAIAEYPRKAVTDPFFLRGLDVDDGALLDAMDVLGDKFHQAKPAKARAKRELEIIVQVMSADVESRRKCAALLRLVLTANEKATLREIG